jgi:hypothetical protein
MAYEVKFHDDGFYLTHEGMITLEEIIEANGEILSHSNFDQHRYQIVNVLAADFTEIDQKASKIPAAIDQAAGTSNQLVKVAVVAAEENAVRFCKDYIDTAKDFGSKWLFRIFRDLKAAEEWVRD